MRILATDRASCTFNEPWEPLRVKRPRRRSAIPCAFCSRGLRAEHWARPRRSRAATSGFAPRHLHSVDLHATVGAYPAIAIGP